MKGTVTDGDRRFGEAVRAAREEFGISMRAASREIGITQASLYHIEKAKYATRLSTGVAVASFFGIDLEETFTGDAA
jgi:DNA-binding XRE family transcriptional regulator